MCYEKFWIDYFLLGVYIFILSSWVLDDSHSIGYSNYYSYCKHY
jgi:hypothetical protein